MLLLDHLSSGEKNTSLPLDGGDGVGRKKAATTTGGVNVHSGVNSTRGRPCVPELQRQHVLLSALSLYVTSHYTHRYVTSTD